MRPRNQATSITRREALTLAGAALSSATLPVGTLALATPVAEAVPSILPPLAPLVWRERDLSHQFRNKRDWLWPKWLNYMRTVERHRHTRDEGGDRQSSINFSRWHLKAHVRSVCVHVPETPDDQEVWRFAAAMLEELLADFPDVAWRQSDLDGALEARAWGIAHGCAPDHVGNAAIRPQTWERRREIIGHLGCGASCD